MKPLTTIAPTEPGPGEAGSLHLAGVLVRTDPEEIETVAAVLDGMSGVQVHHHEAATGKLVVTQEGVSRQEVADALRELQKVPGVRLAEPVYHYVDALPDGPAGGR